MVCCAIPFIKGCREGNELDIREWIMSLCSKRSDINLVSQAAAQTSTPPYWNLWLFLALPTVWLAWSLIFFSAGLLSFVWTSGDRRVPELTPFTDDDTTMDFIPMSFSDFTPLWPRIILTVVLAFGFGVGFLVMQAFKDVGANKWDRSKSKKDNSESSSSSEDDVKVHDG